MSFLGAFVSTLFQRPGRAVEALFWYALGKRQRARNRLRIGAAQSRHAYQQWIAQVEQPNKALAKAEAAIAQWPRRPRLSVLLYQQPGLPPAQVKRSFDALSAQCYPDWELILVQSYEMPPPRALGVPRLTLAPSRAGSLAQALGIGAEVARGEYLLPLASDAVLSPLALYRLAEAALAHPEASVLYGDHDYLVGAARAHPWFKPAWNPDMFLAQDYISQACLLKLSAMRQALPVDVMLADAAAYALVLAMSAAPGARLVHVPHVLATVTGALPWARPAAEQAARVAAAARQLAPQGARAEAGPWGAVQVEWPLPDPLPLVSIIIPTRDRVDLLSRAVLGVVSATRYRAMEVLIVDNGSTDPKTLAYLERIAGNPKVRVLRWDHPFNYAAINNFAAHEARGAYLCLLNNDVEIIDENWLMALVRQAARPEVGAAGAKLLYDDGTVQHAGVVVGMGDAAGHAHRFERNDQPGYFAQIHVTRAASAVTGACLVVARARYFEVGGLDEERFKVAFNDVDFCLRLEEAGYRNIYEPRAVLVHHESRSRQRDFAPAQIERYRAELAALQTRWGTVGYADPLHHPQLDPSCERYLLRLPQLA